MTFNTSLRLLERIFSICKSNLSIFFLIFSKFFLGDNLLIFFFIQNIYLNLWLLSTGLILILLIWVGGLTRLTGSGLSITEWQIFSGILPPLSDLKWNEYFELYKKIPEYQKINYGMTLNEFKFIFWWEYIHRVLARILVLIYFVPLIYFLVKKKLTFSESYYYLIIFILFLLIIKINLN